MTESLAVIPNELQEVIKTSNIQDLTKAEKIASNYAPIMNKVSEQMQLVKELKKGNLEDVEKAKRIRIDLGKIASEAEKQKKADKEVILLEGRFIDALYNSVNAAARLTQREAQEIETYFIEQERMRIEALENERRNLLLPYGEIMPSGLGTMEQSVFEHYLKGQKLAHEARIEAEKKAEEERIAREKAEAEERERQRLENIRLKKEAEEREAQIKAEREVREKKEAEERAKAEAERKAIEEKARIEREEMEAKLKLERERQAKLEAELKAKQEAEAKAKAEEAARIEAELNKGDSAKVQDLINDLSVLRTKYTFKAAKNQKMYNEVNQLLEKVINHIQK